MFFFFSKIIVTCKLSDIGPIHRCQLLFYTINKKIVILHFLSVSNIKIEIDNLNWFGMKTCFIHYSETTRFILNEIENKTHCMIKIHIALISIVSAKQITIKICFLTPEQLRQETTGIL